TEAHLDADSLRRFPGRVADQDEAARQLLDLDTDERDRGTIAGMDLLHGFAMRLQATNARFMIPGHDAHGRAIGQRSSPYRAGDDGAGALHGEHAVDRQTEQISRRA